MNAALVARLLTDALTMALWRQRKLAPRRHKRNYTTRVKARADVFDCFERFSNHQRRRSAVRDQRSPNEFDGDGRRPGNPGQDPESGHFHHGRSVVIDRAMSGEMIAINASTAVKMSAVILFRFVHVSKPATYRK